MSEKRLLDTLGRKNRKLKNIRCRECKNNFRPRDAKTIFCSFYCRWKLWKKNKKTYAIKKLERPWMSSYWHSIRRCRDPKSWAYKYYGKRGIQHFLTKDDVKKLWIRDNASKMNRPCLDRIDPSGNYVFNNCRFIEATENISRAHKKWTICIEIGCKKKAIRNARCSSHSMKKWRAIREGLA